MKALHVVQSLPICCSLAAIGGILEVAATAVTAVPAVREKEGIQLKWWVQWVAIAGNVTLQAIGSLMSHLVATWFGPVSLVVPFFYSATLLSNMVIFGLLLEGEEHFTKNMRVGTHVIVIAAILLPLVGPNIQEDQDISVLTGHWYAIAWFSLLLIACAISGTLLVLVDITKYQTNTRIIILLMARAASISVNLTVSRSFILGPSQVVLISFIVIKILSGAIYTYAIVIQSFVVEQSRFVPLNATTIIIVNALTGVIVWEDWRVVESWYGYICVFVLLGLGCDLLLSVPLLTADNPDFGTNKKASLILKSKALRTLQVDTQHYDQIPDVYGGSELESHDEHHRGQMSRREAWKELVSPIRSIQTSPTGLLEVGSTNAGDQETMHSTATYNWKQFLSPKAVGTSVAKTASTVISAPQNIGKQVLQTTKQIGGAGKGLVQNVSSVSEQAAKGSLSRLAAWKDTISPLKKKPKSKSQQPNNDETEVLL